MEKINFTVLFSCVSILFVQSCKPRDYKDNTSEINTIKTTATCSEIITNGDIDVTIMPGGRNVKAKVSEINNKKILTKDRFVITIDNKTLGGSFFKDKAFVSGYFSTTCYKDKTILLKKENDNPVPCAPVISANKFTVRNSSFDDLITQFNVVPSVTITKDLKFFGEIKFEFNAKTDTGEEIIFNDGKTQGTIVTYTKNAYGRKYVYTGTCSKDTVFAKFAEYYDIWTE